VYCCLARQYERLLKGYLILILNQNCGRKWKTTFFFLFKKGIKLDLLQLFLMIGSRIVKALLIAASLTEKSLPKMQGHLGLVLNVIDSTFHLSERMERKIPNWVRGERECYRHWTAVVRCWKCKIKYIHQYQITKNRNHSSWSSLLIHTWEGNENTRTEWHFLETVLSYNRNGVTSCLYSDIIHWILRNIILGVGVCISSSFLLWFL